MNDKRFAEAFWVAVRFWYIIVIGILLLVGSVPFDKESFTHHLLRDIGISAVVAYVVIVTIEHRQRMEMAESIKKFLGSTNEKIFEAILGVEFPQKMFDFVRDTVMRGNIYRTKTHVNYRIDAAEDDEIVSLEFDSSHVVTNLSGSDQKYDIPFFIEKGSETTLVGKSEGDLVELHIDDKVVSKEELLKADAKWHDTENFIRYNYQINLTGKQKVKVRLRFKTRTKLRIDTEIWRSIHPCDGVSFVLNFPQWMQVQVDGLHYDGIREICRTETVICGAIDRPLYPHNGFMFWWQPRSHPTSFTAQALNVPPSDLK